MDKVKEFFIEWFKLIWYSLALIGIIGIILTIFAGIVILLMSIFGHIAGVAIGTLLCITAFFALIEVVFE